MRMSLGFRGRMLPLAVALAWTLAGCDQGAGLVGPAGVTASASRTGGAMAPATGLASSGTHIVAEQRAAAGPQQEGGARADRPAPAAAAADGGRAEGQGADAAVPAADLPKVAFVSRGAIDESAWAAAHEAGRKALVEAMDGRIHATLTGNVPDAGAEQVFRDLVAQGYRLIFATSPSHRDVVRRLAIQFSEVRWELAGNGAGAPSNAPQPANLGIYQVRAYEGAYLAGVVAGRMTRTDTLGFIASVPVPEIIRNIDAFALGAQSVNPAARVKVAWVNTWFDPVRETEAAQALIDSGADVLLPNTASDKPLKVAERAGKYAFGWAKDMSGVAAASHLGSVAFDWSGYYADRVEGLQAGRNSKAGSRWFGLKEGALDLVGLPEQLPAAVRAELEERRKALASGKLKIWQGPLVSADDRVLLARDKVADDRFLAGLMTYVKGVEGQVPGAR